MTFFTLMANLGAALRNHASRAFRRQANGARRARSDARPVEFYFIILYFIYFSLFKVLEKQWEGIGEFDIHRLVVKVGDISILTF